MIQTLNTTKLLNILLSFATHNHTQTLFILNIFHMFKIHFGSKITSITNRVIKNSYSIFIIGYSCIQLTKHRNLSWCEWVTCPWCKHCLYVWSGVRSPGAGLWAVIARRGKLHNKDPVYTIYIYILYIFLFAFNYIISYFLEIILILRCKFLFWNASF